MRELLGLRTLFAGLIWAALYNAVWGLAWLAFMRREWTLAASSTGHAMPWTPKFWLVWVPLTLLFGFAIAAYLNGASQRERALQSAVAATLILWVPGTMAMALWSFTVRIIVLDSAVNLLALALASIVAGWSVSTLRRPPTRETDLPAA